MDTVWVDMCICIKNGVLGGIEIFGVSQARAGEQAWLVWELYGRLAHSFGLVWYGMVTGIFGERKRWMDGMGVMMLMMFMIWMG
jgi:hypothetical protein